MEEVKEIFNRKLLLSSRKRHAKNFENYNFLYHEIAERIAENLEMLKEFLHPITALEIEPRDGFLSSILQEKLPQNSKIFQTDSYCDKNADFICDKSFLEIKNESFDLIVNNSSFHFINDIPQFLLKVRSALKEGGIFISSFFGEGNLSELRHAIYSAESEIYGGTSPRMAPTIDVKSGARLLQKAGFNNPISNLEQITVEYDEPIKLLKDLQMMSQGNFLHKRSKRFFTKTLLNKTVEKYKKNSDGKYEATFEVVTVCGIK